MWYVLAHAEGTVLYNTAEKRMYYIVYRTFYRNIYLSIEIYLFRCMYNDNDSNNKFMHLILYDETFVKAIRYACVRQSGECCGALYGLKPFCSVFLFPFAPLSHLPLKWNLSINVWECVECESTRKIDWCVSEIPNWKPSKIHVICVDWECVRVSVCVCVYLHIVTICPIGIYLPIFWFVQMNYQCYS